MKETLFVCVCYLLAPWRAGVGWRGAGDVQGTGATAGGGGASDPDRDTQTVAMILKHAAHFLILNRNLDEEAQISRS